jgi:Bacterial archaeo-eukaryotic release factor family 3
MRPLTTEALRELLKDHEPPCISLYQPTHRANPDALQDPIRYKNLVREADRSLREKYSGREVRPLLEPLEALADDYPFWQHQRDGLAVLSAAGRFEVFRLPRPVKELVVVADTFHLKPLLRMLQSAGRYQVLGLDRHKAALYEGNRDALEALDVGDMPATITAALGEQLTEPQQAVGVYGKRAGAGPMAHGGTGSFPGLGGKKDEVDKDVERFFRVIDREVLDRFSRPSGLPLILVALPEYHAEFRRVSRNPFLQPDGVEKDPGSMTPEQLRVEVWRVVEPAYLARLARLTDE